MLNNFFLDSAPLNCQLKRLLTISYIVFTKFAVIGIALAFSTHFSLLCFYCFKVSWFVIHTDLFNNFRQFLRVLPFFLLCCSTVTILPRSRLQCCIIL